jgi:N-acyl-D-amino-acid deacylase
MHDLVIRGGVVVDGTGTPPRPADVAVDDERITAVGAVEGRGHRELDADGLVVMPGFIDVHTHLDAQLLWDDAMEQSAVHGVTSAVVGNCGVGIAPVRSEDRSWLLDLLDGVEEIPADALADVVDFTWETFGEYLDVVARGRYAFDVAAYLPHAALRRFVMGERGADPAAVADESDVAAMSEVASAALRAGAVGISTSRTVNHRTRSDGAPIGTLSAAPGEVLALARACAGHGSAVFQLISDVYQSVDHEYVESELSLIDRLAAVGCPVSMSLLQVDAVPDRYRHVLDRLERLRAGGAEVWAQVAPRPIGGAYAASSRHYPLTRSRTYREVMASHDGTARLRDPAVRARVLLELGDEPAPGLRRLFAMADPPDYSPMPSESIAATAAAAGTSPFALLYDLALGSDEGSAVVYAPFANFAAGDLSAVRRMLESSCAMLGLSDSGAHSTTICDASFPTFAVSYWTRDTVLEPLAVEAVVHTMTGRPSRYLGWHDRGLVAVGRLADLNVVDLDALQVRRPRLVHDLPGGRSRYLQAADGYRATLKRGVFVVEDGELTDARPGRLVRGAA